MILFLGAAGMAGMPPLDSSIRKNRKYRTNFSRSRPRAEFRHAGNRFPAALGQARTIRTTAEKRQIMRHESVLKRRENGQRKAGGGDVRRISGIIFDKSILIL